MTVSDLSERELIARLRRQLPPAPPWMTVGIGDDAAVVETVRNELDVFTVDAIVEGVHFDRRFTPPEAIGHRALAVNLSDLAAMGATPRLALVSLALPASLPTDEFDAMIGGLAALALKHNLHVAGGNLTRSSDPLVVDVTAVGTIKRRGVLTRAGARAGDEIYVTGSVGGARAGLQYLQLGTPDEEMAPAARRFLYPEPRVRAGLLLGRNRAATACMDLSDGLADAVRQVAEASGVGARLDAAALPVDPETRRWFASRRADVVAEVLTGGDDYELMFTVSRKLRGRLRTVARHAGVPLTRIGVCTPERDLRISGTFEGQIVDAPLPNGFSHFR